LAQSVNFSVWIEAISLNVAAADIPLVEWLTLAEIDMARQVLSDRNPLMGLHSASTGLTSSR
jgi:hypothetical protein